MELRGGPRSWGCSLWGRRDLWSSEGSPWGWGVPMHGSVSPGVPRGGRQRGAGAQPAAGGEAQGLRQAGRGGGSHIGYGDIGLAAGDTALGAGDGRATSQGGSTAGPLHPVTMSPVPRVMSPWHCHCSRSPILRATSPMALPLRKVPAPLPLPPCHGAVPVPVPSSASPLPSQGPCVAASAGRGRRG